MMSPLRTHCLLGPGRRSVARMGSDWLFMTSTPAAVLQTSCFPHTTPQHVHLRFLTGQRNKVRLIGHWGLLIILLVKQTDTDSTVL